MTYNSFMPLFFTLPDSTFFFLRNIVIQNAIIYTKYFSAIHTLNRTVVYINGMSQLL